MDITTLALAKKFAASPGTPKTITSSTETGQAGEFCYDADYLYICVATNTWKRISLLTW